MRKLGLLLTLVVVLGIAVSGISAQDGAEFRSTFDLEGPAEEGPLAGVDPSGATVTYWHQHDGAREEVLNELVAQFNEENPWGITVDASNQGGYGDIYQKVIAGLTTGELPTLVVAYQNQSAAYDLGGAVADMDNFVTDATWGFNEAEAADFIPAFFNQDYNLAGKRLGFPPNRSLEALYYNVDALEELGYDGPPTSWDDFREMACAFTESGWSGYEGDDTIGYSVRTDASNVAAMTYALGGDIYDSETGEYNYNNPETISALQFMQDLVNDGCANLIAESYADQDDFAAGKNLFYVGSTSGLPFILAAINEGSENPFNWAVTYLPYSDAPVVDIYGASVSILQGPDISVEEQLAAWLFVRWFTEPEQQGQWAAVSNYFPVRISTTANLDSIFAELPQYEQAWNLLLGAQGAFEPPVASYDVVRDEAEAAFDSVVIENADVESTLEALDTTAADIKAEFDSTAGE